MTDQDTADQNAQGTQPQGPQFAIQSIYLKDCSYESPNTPHVFREQSQPQLNVSLDNEANRLGEGVVEVVVKVTVTVKHGEKTAFLVEAQQAGVFTVAGFPAEEEERMVEAYCPNILFPYAREAVSSLVAKGGFPQLVLTPFNFEALYLQRKHQQEQEQAPEQTH